MRERAVVMLMSPDGMPSRRGRRCGADTPRRAPRRPTTTTLAWALLVGVMLLGAAGCTAGPGVAAGVDAAGLAGFWQGVWHGLISPISFLVSLFTDSVSVYEVHNNGNWYDAGFMVGISTVFSSSARSGVVAQRRRDDRRRAKGSSH